MTIFKTPLALAGISLITLGACVQEPQYAPNGDPRVAADNRARTGALIGAAAGALAGAASDSDNRARNAALGAALGGGAGATVGSVLDRQAQELRTGLSNGAIDVVNTGQQLIVRLPQDVTFAVDSTRLASSIQGDLRVLSQTLNRYPGSSIQVVGHTDSTGAAAYNQNLSERRASAVASVLTQYGVAPQRVSITGAGEDRPLASNLTPEGRAQNRRVEIVIVPDQR